MGVPKPNASLLADRLGGLGNSVETDSESSSTRFGFSAEAEVLARGDLVPCGRMTVKSFPSYWNLRYDLFLPKTWLSLGNVQLNRS